MLTYTATVNTASTTQIFLVADYTDAVIRMVGVWDGNVEFYASNSKTQGEANLSPIAVQDIESTNWTTAVTSNSGASPSLETKIYRVPVAGLGELAVKTSSGFVGSVLFTVTAVSNTNAR